MQFLYSVAIFLTVLSSFVFEGYFTFNLFHQALCVYLFMCKAYSSYNSLCRTLKVGMSNDYKIAIICTSFF